MKNLLLLTVIFIVMKYVPRTEALLRCYQCLQAFPLYYTNDTVRLCKDFDYSDKFIVECPYSTFCVKKITSAKIPVPINGTERGCASQKLETQNYKNGMWYAEVEIREPYEEGCRRVNDKGLRTSHSEHCYCKGDLCNGAEKIYNSKYSIITCFITLLSVIALNFR